MESRGYLKEIRKGGNGNFLVFEVDAIPADLDELKENLLSIKAVKYKEKRSLDANSYFHVLVDKLRKVLRISFPACKNYLITSYGQVEYIDDVPVVIKTNLPPHKMEQHETLHCKAVRVEVQDKEVWFYRVYRGSHTYTSTEMAMLIDGTVEECKLQGIETLPPDKLEEMKRAWERNHVS